jgi:hypothetical protein
MMVFCRSIISHHNSFALSKMDRLMRGRGRGRESMDDVSQCGGAT